MWKDLPTGISRLKRFGWWDWPYRGHGCICVPTLSKWNVFLIEPGTGAWSDPVVGDLEPRGLIEMRGWRMLWRGWVPAFARPTSLNPFTLLGEDPHRKPLVNVICHAWEPPCIRPRSMHLGSVERSYSDLSKSSALPAAETRGVCTLENPSGIVS